ncbi:hypothetical protein BDR04DRAFT_1091091 [Suillus decipiens]|nr:hypothetical protein BDR04DRAFT_1091091 [Suillus decipiens]
MLFLFIAFTFCESLFSLPQGSSGGISDQEKKDGSAVSRIPHIRGQQNYRFISQVSLSTDTHKIAT